MDLHYSGLKVNHNELCKGEYHCQPRLCGDNVCCAKFDIAITLEERDRIAGLLPLLVEYCPWLENAADSPFLQTPCEVFIRKRPEGQCWFNYQDYEGRWWCALHSAALRDGENPFAWKPLNCSLWPFLRDGANRLHLDDSTRAPCLQIKSEPTDQTMDMNLLDMLEKIGQGLSDADN